MTALSVTACWAFASVACGTASHAEGQRPARVSERIPTAALGDGPASSMEAPEVVPIALRRLATSVDALEQGADPRHQKVLRALRAAADALRTLDASAESDREALSVAADRIEGSASGAQSHADDLLAGMKAARGRLGGLGGRAASAPAFESALAVFDEAVAALDPRRPLLAQQPATARAFRALADTIFLAAGQNAPFVGQRRSTLARPSSDELMDQLRSHTSALARADVRTLRTRAAQGMAVLAELVDELSGRTGGTEEAQEIMFQAERLRREESAPFARSEWVGRGLLAALRRLDEVETCHPERVDEWVELARRAATDLPDHGTLSFQHARVQDAFRATVDAFGVALLDQHGCSRDARSEAADAPPRLSAETR